MAEEPTPPVATEAEQPAVKRDGHSMAVKVYAPFKMYYEGEASSVSAVNATGPFDILPKHHNFLCMLIPCVIKIVTPDGVKEVKVHRALMHVKADQVVVYMDV